MRRSCRCGDCARIPAELRRAVLADLRCPLWCDATDDELAERHDTSADVVRALRAEHTRRLYTAEVLAGISRLRAAIGPTALTDAELLLVALELALALHARPEVAHA